jgi:hypothetical protein
LVFHDQHPADRDPAWQRPAAERIADAVFLRALGVPPAAGEEW